MDRFVIEEDEYAIQMQRRLQNVPASRRFLLVSHPEDAARCFCYPGDIPDGAFGDVDGNFSVSGYRCPHCAQRLYKTVFPEGNDPRLPIAPDGRRYLEPARVFASPCGRFFAAPKGMRLTDGVFLQAILVFDGNDRAQAEEFSRWWDFFDARGDLLATRRE